jgi:transcriptional regulator with XRE-family HTH domain
MAVRRWCADGNIAGSVVKLPGLRRRRLEATLTQEELGRLAGVQRFTVTRLENGGEARPSTVRKLADVLNCSARELMQEPPAS